MKAGVEILISDTVGFKTEYIIKDKEGHHIMIKRSIKEEAIAFANIYVPNTGAPKYIKQILPDIKGEIDNNTIVGVFNIHLYQWTDHPD